eukprot:CAMPEP_0197456416 /NCGR_PEP_ID=MMETSP1175-20131217/43298_1 /TAXON_ID=1003142 /ORGANISM="Triceratium dubium, Strain CCMP147" /LENGTH=280 /DNA_ID=CAMNT_0042990487 /DNA_START=100 /DNA_END=942 /DNA_ORIENTATION=-
MIRGRGHARKRNDPEKSKRKKKLPPSKKQILRLEENDPTLTRFRMSNKGIGAGLVGSTEPVFVAITNALRVNTCVTKLELGGNSIGSTEGWIAYGHVLSYDSHNSGFAVFCKALAQHPVIREVCLWNNGVTCRGAELIAQSLRKNTSLKKIDLSTNNIGDIGALALAGALAHNSTLEELNLSGNNIGDEGMKRFAEVLVSKRNVTLRRLSVGDQRTCHHRNHISLIRAHMVSKHVDAAFLQGGVKNYRLYPEALSRVGSCCTLDTVFSLVRDRVDIFGKK